MALEDNRKSERFRSKNVDTGPRYVKRGNWCSTCERETKGGQRCILISAGSCPNNPHVPGQCPAHMDKGV